MLLYSFLIVGGISVPVIIGGILFLKFKKPVNNLVKKSIISKKLI